MDKNLAIETLKSFVENTDNVIAKDAILTLHPELAENEDERIRNEILLYIGSKQDINLDTHNRWCTYLENRKKQKPTELPKSEDYGIDGLYAAVDILQKTLGEVDGYQTDDGILEHKCAISAVKELYEQKPAEWSEEDEDMYARIVRRYTDYEGVIMRTKEESVAAKMLDAMAQEEIWLKSLRPQPHWKPSEEQMEALYTVLEHEAERIGPSKPLELANGIYDVLKKL